MRFPLGRVAVRCKTDGQKGATVRFVMVSLSWTNFIGCAVRVGFLVPVCDLIGVTRPHYDLIVDHLLVLKK